MAGRGPQAPAINPRYPHAYVTLGGVLYDARRYRNAREQYRAAALAGDDAAQNADALAQWLAAHPDAK